MMPFTQIVNGEEPMEWESYDNSYETDGYEPMEVDEPENGPESLRQVAENLTYFGPYPNRQSFFLL